MNLFKLLLIVLFVFAALCGNLFSQSFRVDSYIPEKFTDTEWRVNGSTRVNGSSSNTEDEAENIFYNSDNSDNSQSLSMSNSLKYRYITVPKYLSTGFSLGTSYNHSSSDSYNKRISGLPNGYDQITNADRSSSRFAPYLSGYMDGGNYFENNILLSAIFKFSLRYDQSTSDNRSDSRQYNHFADDSVSYHFSETDRELDRNNYSNNISLEILPGWGHLYEGQYAATAIYMIDELKDHGYITNDPTDEQMIKLTDIIYQYRLKHYIDSRLHEIEALTSVVEYLKVENVIDSTIPNAQIIIQDVWNYFPKHTRQFGLRVRAGAGIRYAYSKATNIETRNDEYYSARYHIDTPADVQDVSESSSLFQGDEVRRSTDTREYLKMMIEYCKPISKEWQLDNNIQFTMYSDHTREYQHRRTYSYDGSFFNVFTRLEEIEYTDSYDFDQKTNLYYIPNSRTLLNFRLNTKYMHYNRRITINQNDTEILNDKENFGYFRGSLLGRADYRISIPTTLSASVGCDFIHSDTQDSFNYTVSLGISHYLL